MTAYKKTHLQLCTLFSTFSLRVMLLDFSEEYIDDGNMHKDDSEPEPYIIMIVIVYLPPA